MPVPTDVTDAADALTQIYEEALQRVEAQIETVLASPDRASLRTRLSDLSNELNALLDEVDQQARQWTGETLPRIYERGAGSFVVGLAAALGIDPLDALNDFTMPSRTAVERLAAGLTDDLLAATSYVGRNAKRIIRQSVRSGTISTLLEGSTAKTGAAQVWEELQTQGLMGVRYANGANVPLDVYANMAVRSVSALAYNGGQLDSARSNDCGYMEVFDGPDCGWTDHDDPDEADGSIRSVDDCEEYPIAHPNCLRAFGPRPDITSDEEAANADALGEDAASTEADQMAQAEADGTLPAP